LNEHIQQAEAVFRSLNREVWVVTSAHEDRRGGLLATWVSQASLNPDKPVLLVGLAPNHNTTDLVNASGYFAAHLLNPTQQQLAWNFSRDSGRRRDKLQGLACNPQITAAPILENCHSYLLGKVYAKVETGERSYFWADVMKAVQCSNEPPLCEQDFIKWCDDDQKQVLRADKTSDIALQRPQQMAYRQALPDWFKGTH